MDEASFLIKLRYVSRFYRQLSQERAEAYKKEELDTRAKLEVATKNLHEDIYNVVKHEEVSEHKEP